MGLILDGLDLTQILTVSVIGLYLFLGPVSSSTFGFLSPNPLQEFHVFVTTLNFLPFQYIDITLLALTLKLSRVERTLRRKLQIVRLFTFSAIKSVIKFYKQMNLQLCCFVNSLYCSSKQKCQESVFSDDFIPAPNFSYSSGEDRKSNFYSGFDSCSGFHVHKYNFSSFSRRCLK